MPRAPRSSKRSSGPARRARRSSPARSTAPSSCSQRPASVRTRSVELRAPSSRPPSGPPSSRDRPRRRPGMPARLRRRRLPQPGRLGAALSILPPRDPRAGPGRGGRGSRLRDGDRGAPGDAPPARGALDAGGGRAAEALAPLVDGAHPRPGGGPPRRRALGLARPPRPALISAWRPASWPRRWPPSSCPCAPSPSASGGDGSPSCARSCVLVSPVS